MMRALITLGADSTAETYEGAGAVLLATRSRNLEAVQLTVELGLDINRYPSDTPSALHEAIRVGQDAIVQYLVSNGADLNAQDHYGRTPLEEAEFEAPTHTIVLMRQLTRTSP